MRYRDIALFLALAGCDGPTGAAPSASSASSASRTSTATSTAITSSAAPAVEEKRHAHTPDDALGKLPDGVGIAVGDKAPEFALKDQDGKEVTLSELLAERDLLLFFHRGTSCPYSQFQVSKLARNADGFKPQGIRVAMISVDPVDAAAAMKKRHAVPFPLLADPDKTAHRAYRVLDAEGHAAIPAVFLIMRDGKIRWAHADRDITTRPSVDKLAEVVPLSL